MVVILTAGELRRKPEDRYKLYPEGNERSRDEGFLLYSRRFTPTSQMRGAVIALTEHLSGKTVLMDALGENPVCRPEGNKPTPVLAALASLLEKCAADGLMTFEDPLYASSALFGCAIIKKRPYVSKSWRFLTPET